MGAAVPALAEIPNPTGAGSGFPAGPNAPEDPTRDKCGCHRYGGRWVIPGQCKYPSTNQAGWLSRHRISCVWFIPAQAWFIPGQAQAQAAASAIRPQGGAVPLRSPHGAAREAAEPEMASGWPGTGQNGLRMARDSPGWLRMAQDGPRTAAGPGTRHKPGNSKLPWGTSGMAQPRRAAPSHPGDPTRDKKKLFPLGLPLQASSQSLCSSLRTHLGTAGVPKCPWGAATSPHPGRGASTL